eukprot:8641943-Pyramimonas_sp.AAC.1
MPFAGVDQGAGGGGGAAGAGAGGGGRPRTGDALLAAQHERVGDGLRVAPAALAPAAAAAEGNQPHGHWLVEPLFNPLYHWRI